VLSYISGTPIVPPYPDWALTDEALMSVAELLRSYHSAASTFDPSSHAWPPSPPQPFGGDLVSHNDPNLDNIIFRDGRAAALIDFDLASPGSRVWDVACAARLWVPLRPDAYVRDVRRGRALDRFRLFVDTYGLEGPDRYRVVDAVEQNRAWFWELMESSALAGHAGFAAYCNAEARDRARDSAEWLSANDRALRAALDR
jgi:thiamine kinase-like enzyme